MMLLTILPSFFKRRECFTILKKISCLFTIVYNFSYIATLEENAPEGTALSFVGGFDRVQDFDKVTEMSSLLFGVSETLKVTKNIKFKKSEYVWIHSCVSWT